MCVDAPAGEFAGLSTLEGFIKGVEDGLNGIDTASDVVTPFKGFTKKTLKDLAKKIINKKKPLHRPYVRKTVREEVEKRAPKTNDGYFRDPNTGKPIKGKYDLGHKRGHEFKREKLKAEEEGLSQSEFNDRMNNPDLYQIEDPSTNRSHVYELP